MKTEIYVSYFYGAYSIAFKRTFELPFTPFFGMRLIYDTENDWEITLDNDEYCRTLIDYNTVMNQFEIDIRNVWKRPVDDEKIDEVIEMFSSWIRVDTTDIKDIKELMADNN